MEEDFYVDPSALMNDRSRKSLGPEYNDYYTMEDYLENIDRNCCCLPGTAQILMDLEDIKNFTKKELLRKVQEYWSTRLQVNKLGEWIEEDIKNIFAYSKQIISLERSFFTDSKENFLDYYFKFDEVDDNEDTLEWKMNECLELRKNLEGALMIHIDVKRAFDNLNLELMYKALDILKKERKLKLLHSYVNLLKKWLAVVSKEELKIDGFESFRRTYGGPQGSLWMSAIWNLYVALVLKNSPLKGILKLYADNLFLWLPENKVKESYIKKVMEVLKLNLGLVDLEINEDEVYVFWYGQNKKYFNVCSKIFAISSNQKILGFNFELKEYEWKFKLKFFLPKPPRGKIRNMSFKEKLNLFKQKGVGSLYYQLKGLVLFARDNSFNSYDWKKIDQCIRNSFIQWSGLNNISYWDLTAIGILPRAFLLDRITQSILIGYESREKDWQNEQNKAAAHELWEDVISHTKHRYFFDFKGNAIDQLKVIKMRDNFVSKIVGNRNKMDEFADKIIESIEKSGYNEVLQGTRLFQEFKFKNEYNEETKKVVKGWIRLANYHRRYDIRRRNSKLASYEDPLNNMCRIDLRIFWHLVLNKTPLVDKTDHVIADIKKFLGGQISADQIIMNVLNIEYKDIKSPKKTPVLNNKEWNTLEKLVEIVTMYHKNDFYLKYHLKNLCSESNLFYIAQNYIT